MFDTASDPTSLAKTLCHCSPINANTDDTELSWGETIAVRSANRPGTMLVFPFEKPMVEKLIDGPFLGIADENPIQFFRKQHAVATLLGLVRYLIGHCSRL